MNFDSLKSLTGTIDWRALRALANPKAGIDLNTFMEKLPYNAGQTMLIIAAAVWAGAGLTGLYTIIQMKKLTELRATVQEAGALKPAVPVVADVVVPGGEIEKFVENASKIYGGLTIQAGGSSISITAKSTGDFGQFREAVGHVQNGGAGWKVHIESLCVGRECVGAAPLAASLSINRVSVEKAG